VDQQGRTSAIDQHERTAADVLKDIGSNLQQIVRSEIVLARMELSETAQQARSAGVMLGGGGVLAVLALAFLLLAGMFALAIVLSLWLSALIVSILSLIAALTALSRGRQRLKAIRPPRDTIETVKENLKWMKEEPRS